MENGQRVKRNKSKEKERIGVKKKIDDWAKRSGPYLHRSPSDSSYLVVSPCLSYSSESLRSSLLR